MINIINSKADPSKVDGLVKDFVGSLICNQYFVWTCFVLFLNYKRWKRPVIIILVLHWLFRSIGDIFLNYQDFMEKKYPNWPWNNDTWFYCFGIASIFWYLSEIFGDWYPLLRTTAIIRNPKKIRIVYIICGIYNMVKLVQMYFYITYVPYTNPDIYPDTEEGKNLFNKLYNKDLGRFKSLTWGNVVIQLIVSFFYDLSIIIILRKNLFNKLNERKNNLKENENKFLSRFKFISEYRIVVSLIATVVSFPLIATFSFIMVHQFRTKDEFDIDDSRADAFRQCVLSINYNLMYVDQILLRFFVDESTKLKSKPKLSIGTSGNSGYTSSSYAYNSYSLNNISSHTYNNSHSIYKSSNDTSNKENLYKEFSNADKILIKSNTNNSDEIPIISYSNKDMSYLSSVTESHNKASISNISPIDKYYPLSSSNYFNMNNKNYYNHNY
ncbi:hypothetical protein BCR36DRAFT_450235 [Piromyces finnis]|uniref:Uncharacterized protein n=1 Tax=Piromyces finnis TaxID=1754191 RepID=A0A1Y1V849_9FUNG|nr:hypothetical protein BCR36DRAFT_450235 [Piromyces finnis]|eukprot:ORX49637.1 hypothetical protein BCR36DRAFT_450235 [Piromyces finnis]